MIRGVILVVLAIADPTILTRAGTGQQGYGGDGGPAVGLDGDVWIGDTNNHRIRVVHTTP